MIVEPIRCVAILLTLIGLLAAASSADTVRWINPSGGSFEDNGNWDRGSPPSAGDAVVFDLDAAYSVTVNQNRGVGGLTFAGGDVTLNLQTFSLTVILPGAGSSAFTVQPAAGTAIVRLQGGTMPYGRGGVHVASGGQLFISGTQMSDTSCPNCSGQYVTFDSGTAITVESGGTLNSLVNNTFGATVLISGAGILRADVMNVSGDITVTGSGSALGAESALTVGGTLRVLAAGSLRAFQNGCQVHVNAATIVSGPGSTITAGPNVSANGSGSLVIGAGGLFHGGVSGPILVQQEGALLVTNSCAGPVIIESGGVLNAAGYFYERVQALAGARIVPGVTMSFANGLTLDSETDIAGPGSLWALPQGLTINWDALSPRTTAFLSGASNCSLPYIEELGGPLTVNVRNANALRVGRTLPVLVHGTCAGADSGSFNLFVAPSLDGGRVLTMIQTGNIGTVSISVVAGGHSCWGTDFNGDGDLGTDADIEAFFACLAGNCCPSCGSADFNADGDLGTDADIESFFRVLGGGPC